MASEISLADISGIVGTEVGVSGWIVVDQARIDLRRHPVDMVDDEHHCVLD